MTRATTASGSVIRKTDPHSNSVSSAPADERPERGDRATEGRPQRDRLRPRRPRPQRGDQRERRRVCHAGRKTSADAGDEQHFVGRREGGEQRHRDREGGAEDEHHLASVAVAERAEVEHRGRQPERVPDRDQVEHHLRRVERLPDRRQSDVRDRQVQVRDRRDEDQADEDDAALARERWSSPSPSSHHCRRVRSSQVAPIIARCRAGDGRNGRPRLALDLRYRVPWPSRPRTRRR